MKKALLVVGILALLVAGVLLLRSRRQVTLPGTPSALGILPGAASQTKSLAEIRSATQSPDAAVRREALRTLGRLEDHREVSASEILPFLEKGAADSDAGVRAVAAAYLRLVRVEPARVVPLLTTLLKDPDWAVRMNAVQGLGRSGVSPDALPPLLATLDDENRDVRLNAANALLYFKDARYTPPPAWSALSREEAAALARKMGLILEGPALHRAVMDKDMAGVYVLLKAGVDPNALGKDAPITPLFLTGGTRPEIVRFLLDAGADVHAKDGHGRTLLQALGSASGAQGEETRRLLREAGAR